MFKKGKLINMFKLWQENWESIAIPSDLTSYHFEIIKKNLHVVIISPPWEHPFLILCDHFAGLRSRHQARWQCRLTFNPLGSHVLRRWYYHKIMSHNQCVSTYIINIIQCVHMHILFLYLSHSKLCYTMCIYSLFLYLSYKIIHTMCI
jgi:hypothetical protein